MKHIPRIPFTSAATLVLIAVMSAAGAGAPLPVTLESGANVYPTLSAPQYVELADLDLDGKLDVLVASSQREIAIHWNSGDGQFVQTNLTPGGTVACLAVADLDRDGLPDIAVGTNRADGAAIMKVLRGLGSRQFSLRDSTRLGLEPELPVRIRLADLNRDDRLDVAVLATYRAAIVLANTVSGFGPADQYFLATINDQGACQMTDIAVDDWSLDGWPDLTFSGMCCRATLINQRNGGFALGGVSDPICATAQDTLDTDGLPPTELVVTTAQDSVRTLRFDGAVFRSVSAIDATPNLSGEHTRDVEVADFTQDGRSDVAVAADQVVLLRAPEMAPIRHEAGGSPIDLSSGDVDGDGVTDLLVANGSSNTFSILWGMGGGFRRSFSRDVGMNAEPIVVADCNRDGYRDLLLATPGGEWEVQLGGSDGFGQLIRLSVALDPSQTTVGDLDEDGVPDIVGVVADPGGGSLPQLRIHRGLGDGTFADGIDFGTVGSVRDPRVGDVTGDGHADIVARESQSTSDMIVLVGDGSGASFVPAHRSVGQLENVNIAVADVDRDGTDDIIAVGAYSRVLRARGDLAFEDIAIPTDSHVTGEGLEVVDVDGDGFLDLVHLSSTPNVVKVQYGVAGGRFGAPQSYPSGVGRPGRTASVFRLGDLDGDGVQDFVTSDRYSYAVSLGDGQRGFRPLPVGFALEYPASFLLIDDDHDGHLDLVSAGGNRDLSIVRNRFPRVAQTLDLEFFEIGWERLGLRVSWRFARASRSEAVFLERADSRDGPWSRTGLILDVDGATHTAVVPIPGGASWSYRLAAPSAGGEGQTFGPFDVSANSRLDLQGINATILPGGVRLSWLQSVAGAGEVLVERLRRFDTQWTTLSGAAEVDGDSTHFTDLTPVRDVDYTYRIRTQGPAAVWSWQDPVRIRALWPLVLTSFELRESRPHVVEVRWTYHPSLPPSDQRIDRGPSATGPWTELSTRWRFDGSFVQADSTPASGQTYWYRLRASASVTGWQEFPPESIATQEGLSLLSFEAVVEDDRVRLRGEILPAVDLDEIEIDRAEAGLPWARIPVSLEADGDGFQAIDHDVRQGARYQYRLRVRWLGESLTLDEIEAAVGPVVTRLDLNAFPNPVAGPIRIRFGLPEAGRVRVELLDLQGRCLATLADAVAGLGVHDIDWDVRALRNARGVCFLRVTTSRERRVQRVVIVP